MASFKDAAGREWHFEITYLAIKRVRALAGVDLLDVGKSGGLTRLLGDPILLCDTLYALCKPQCDAIAISDEEFGKALRGDVLGDAYRAVSEDLAGFFQSPAEREAIRRLVQGAQTLRRKLTDRIATVVTEERVDQVIEQTLARLTVGSGSSPESSASIPTPSHSGP